VQGLSREEYNAKKEAVADTIVKRLEKELFPGLVNATTFREVVTMINI
jgi:prolycopene isomerase